MNVDLKRSGSGTAIVVGGQLTFANAGRLHQGLLEAFAGAEKVELFLHDVQEADLSFLQLLCSAHRTAAARGVPFTVGGLASASPVLRLIREAGLERNAGCPEGCLWTGIGAADSGVSPAVDDGEGAG